MNASGRLLLGLALVCSAALPALAQDGLIGTYDLQGKPAGGGRAYTGQVVIRVVEERMLLEAELSTGERRRAWGFDLGAGWEFPLEANVAAAPNKDGLVDRLEDSLAGDLEEDEPEGDELLVLHLRPLGGGKVEGELRRGETVLANERLRRQRGALFVPSQTSDTREVNAFKAYASQLRGYYRGKGYKRIDILAGTSIEGVIARLLQAEHDGTPYDRLVFIGHGGWDGPIVGDYSSDGTSQASGEYNQEVFAELVDAIRRGTTAEARIFSSSCHAGGSNRYELADGGSTYRWVDDVAARTGRIAAGPSGITSTEYTLQGVQAALEGEGVVVQETRWAGPQGVRTIPGKGSLQAARLQPWPTAAPAAPAATAGVVDAPLGEAP